MSVLETSPARSRVDGPVRWQHAAALIVVTLPFLPMLTLHFLNLWNGRPHYQLFPFVLIGAPILAVSRSRHIGTLIPGPRWLTYSTLALAYGAAAGAAYLSSPWLGAVAALLFALVVVLALGGFKLLASLWPVWVFLWLIVPPPFQFDSKLITFLQTRTTWWSSRLLDSVGVYHLADGHVIRLPEKHLFVDEACSGIHSLFAVLACSLFWVMWKKRPWVHSALLVLGALIWVLAANVLRVFTITYAASVWQIDLSSGWLHEALGIANFICVVVLIWSSDHLLTLAAPANLFGWLRKRRPLSIEDDQEPLQPTIQSGPTRFPSFAATGLLAWPALALAVICAIPVGLCLARSQPTLTEVVQRLENIDKDTLPQRWEAPPAVWEQKEFAIKQRPVGNFFGEFSRVWAYDNGDKHALAAIDYPFSGWHDLTVCYKSHGWRVNNQVSHSSHADHKDLRFLEVDMSRSVSNGYLLYCIVDEKGACLPPPSDGPERLAHRLAEAPEPTFQIQLFVETFIPLTDAEKAASRSLYKDMVMRVQRKSASH